MAVNCVKHEKVNIRDYPELNEKRIMDIIAKDPSILGLGDLVFKEKEEEQLAPAIERFEMSLENKDAAERFAVEIQIKYTDNILAVNKLVEFWSVERKKYPEHKHYAVMILEDITGYDADKFLSYVKIFKGFIPFIVIQMNAIKIGDDISLMFTKMLDLRGAEKTAATADEVLRMVGIISTGKYINSFEDYMKAVTEKINKLDLKKDDDFLRGELFAYYTVIDILSRQSYYVRNTYWELNEEGVILANLSISCDDDDILDYISDKNEFKIIEKIVNECDPFKILSQGVPSGKYTSKYYRLIVEITLQLKSENSTEYIADIVSNVFKKYANENEKLSDEDCIYITENIKNALDKIRK